MRDLGHACRRRCGYRLVDPDLRSIQFGKKPLRFVAKLSGARAFEVYLWTGRTLLNCRVVRKIWCAVWVRNQELA